MALTLVDASQWVRLSKLARRIEDEVGDGTPFFDRLDDALSDPYWYEVQARRYTAALHFLHRRIVVSGAWGLSLVTYLRGADQLLASMAHPLILPGGLRHADLDPIEDDLRGQAFVFLDDSCYLGRTRGKIKARIEEAGGFLEKTLVVYDGSAGGIEGVQGLYRYHDDPLTKGGGR